jgi:hypothetical protein
MGDTIPSRLRVRTKILSKSAHLSHVGVIRGLYLGVPFLWRGCSRDLGRLVVGDAALTWWKEGVDLGPKASHILIVSVCLRDPGRLG